MSAEKSARPATCRGEPPPEHGDAFDVAIASLGPLTLALTSEIAKLAYPGAVCARRALELALMHAESLAQWA